MEQNERGGNDGRSYQAEKSADDYVYGNEYRGHCGVRHVQWGDVGGVGRAAQNEAVLDGSEKAALFEGGFYRQVAVSEGYQQEERE